MTFGQALIAYFIHPVLTLLVIVIFINVILSWLVGFNVVNPRNQLVSTIGRVTEAITAPLLNPIRRILPSLGGIDFSPLVLLLLVFFVRDWLVMGQLWGALG
ncbi:YggT family protein [Alkalicaulis satelles]|uniref:YggT family protein n=1 Tax=Alkalicaulis satelles TaxID=2609175 RepID=A0A5M6ZFE8_9PROT|nr:YggT family protein [Alkalicaulis satelles]KAA5803449.1 YggT family protein [Alkalicaulis satelles]